MTRLPTVCALVVCMLTSAQAFAQGYDMYGDVEMNTGLGFENASSVVGELGGDLSASFTSDLYINFRQEDRYDFLVDILLAMDDPSVPGSLISLSLIQCYFMIPFEGGQFYVGKRYREIGWSDFFNVINRISPRAFSSTDFRGDPPVHMQLGISAYPFFFNVLASFDGVTDWADMLWLLSASYLSGGLSAELGAYLHNQEDIHGYASVRCAGGAFSFFAEGMVDARPEQDVPVFDDPNYSFQDQYEKFSWLAVAGIGYGTGGHSLKLEYLHRSQGYDGEQTRTFVEWVEKWEPPDLPIPMAQYAPFAFASDYAAFNYDWAGFLIPELGLRTTFAASLPGLFTSDSFDWDAVSAFAALRLNWALRQELTVSLSGSTRLGGVLGEFIALLPAIADIALSIRLSF